MIHSNGSRYSARLRHAMDAMYRCFPKKHIPMLFHSCARVRCRVWGFRVEGLRFTV